jgi:phage baseplate assembly protein W
MVDYVVNKGANVAIPNASVDLDLTFNMHPTTGDVTTRTDTDAIRRAVRNIVETNKYERPFKPNFGGSVRDLLFELDTTFKVNRVKARLKEMIEIFEPRVEGVFIQLSKLDNTLNVTVFYNIKNGIRNQEINFTITRTR